ncbi:cystathionine gamma-synthase family protein [Okeania sp. SIO1H5]|uniref:cystathionine gamma-synthase family protein n=1 Tax=Okeania sp. SIO1H5 TaxID=2607777 RepID=UPI00257BA448|nr:cystathionine gamma-synthase family protein [Okeania sp. SIO1H5]
MTTTILHSDRQGGIEHGSLHKPIHTSVAYGYTRAEELAEVFQNKSKGYAYGRQANPTVRALEDKVTHMEEGVGSVAFGTGMAAIGSTILAMLRKGDHIVASVFLFGNTASLLNTIQQVGVEVTFVDATKAENVRQAIQPRTKMVFVETIANPMTQVADLKGIGDLCQEHRLVYVVDNTMTTPYLFSPRTVHASLVVHSLTKYIGGHGNALGGSVTDTGLFEWTQFENIYDLYKGGDPKQWALMQIRKKGLRDFGASLSPEAAHLLAIGAETLALRVERSSQNAQKVTEFLSQHPAVENVHYPGLSSHPQHRRTQELFHRPGSLFSFVPKKDPFSVLNELDLVINSSNLGDNRTLAIPVAHTIFYELGAEKRKAMGISDATIRVSTGIEDPEDLLNEFEKALGPS